MAQSTKLTAIVSPLRGEWIEMIAISLDGEALGVSPLRGEWIEMGERAPSGYSWRVSPLRGEWIEIAGIQCG